MRAPMLSMSPLCTGFGSPPADPFSDAYCRGLDFGLAYHGRVPGSSNMRTVLC